MQCERCGQREATVYLRRIRGDQGVVRAQNLCTECAGPVDRLAELWKQLQTGGPDVLTPEFQAELTELMARFGAEVPPRSPKRPHEDTS
jgi:protein-arginine kinase activator protein McsA